MVDGLGDEVVLFLFSVALGGVLFLAWLSSNVRERPRVEAVLVQQVRPGVVVAEEISRDDAMRAADMQQQRSAADTQTEEAEEAVEAEAVATEADENASVGEHSGPKESTSEAPATETPAASSSSESSPTDSSSSSSVKIRIKYLDDRQREVTARLTDRLGGFKRLHFASDMSGDKTVRLIFNGHVLSSDSQTLEQCGLYDNCTIHCLVSTVTNRQQQQQGQQGQQQQHAHQLPPLLDDLDGELDLSQICFPLIGFILVVVWWVQVAYPHFFSLASTISLVSLTIIFVASVINTYVY